MRAPRGQVVQVLQHLGFAAMSQLVQQRFDPGPRGSFIRGDAAREADIPRLQEVFRVRILPSARKNDCRGNHAPDAGQFDVIQADTGFKADFYLAGGG